MPARTFKFQGKAYSTTDTVSVTASFNGVQIHNGTVPTTNSPAPSRNTADLEDLFQYVGTTDLSGNVAFSLAVTGGSVFFGLPIANYSGFTAEINTDTDPWTWGNVITPPEDYWQDVNMNTEQSDGKLNVLVDGAPQERQVVDPQEELGDWQYLVPDGSILTCEIFVDPGIITPSIPPNPIKPDVPPQ
jgi:hypothetical protein